MSKKKHSLIKAGNKNSITQFTETQELVLMARSSPLPPPSELREYEQIAPGITDRLMTSVEKQQNHRMELEKTVIKTDSARSLRGQVFAFILAAIAIIGGIVLLLKGLNIAGLSVLVGTTTTLSGAFIYGKSQNRKEREAKTKQNPIIEN
jgi:hypothetical protein